MQGAIEAEWAWLHLTLALGRAPLCVAANQVRCEAYNGGMANRETLGGVIHTYQRYDPAKFPSPTQPPPDLVSPAMEHMLMFGEHRELTAEELARAIHLDPSQIAGLGPSIDALIAMLEERKRKILAKYETKSARRKVEQAFVDQATET